MFSSLTLIYLLFVFKRIVEISCYRSYFHIASSDASYFVLSIISCCSIFKDQPYAASLSGDFVIISYPSRLVKRFLKSFFNFFLALLRASPYRTAFIFYHIPLPLSRGFLHFFAKIIFLVHLLHFFIFKITNIGKNPSQKSSERDF